MDFTQEQITEILSEFSSKKENGYQTILKIALEAMMKSERDEFNLQSKDVQTRVRLYENYPFEFHQFYKNKHRPRIFRPFYSIRPIGNHLLPRMFRSQHPPICSRWKHDNFYTDCQLNEKHR